MHSQYSIIESIPCAGLCTPLILVYPSACPCQSLHFFTQPPPAPRLQSPLHVCASVSAVCVHSCRLRDSSYKWNPMVSVVFWLARFTEQKHLPVHYPGWAVARGKNSSCSGSPIPRINAPVFLYPPVSRGAPGLLPDLGDCRGWVLCGQMCVKTVAPCFIPQSSTLPFPCL